MTQNTGGFSTWGTVPLVVRVILVVPRENFQVVDSLAEEIGAPTLDACTRGCWSQFIHGITCLVRNCDPDGNEKSSPGDIQGGSGGSSSVVISFTMSAGLLTLELAEHTRIYLSIRSTPAAVTAVVKRLGLEQSVFSANLMDEYHVHVLPQDPFPVPPKKSSGWGGQVFQIGNADPVAVELDEECELVSRLTSMVHVENTDAKALFGSGTMPEISQVSPCVMQLAIGKHVQNLVYPIPIIGGQNKLRLARKSSYIKVCTVVLLTGLFTDLYLFR